MINNPKSDTKAQKLSDYKKKIEFLNYEILKTNEIMERIYIELTDSKMELKKRKTMCDKDNQCDLDQDD